MDNRCENYSGADLRALVRESAMNALRRTVFVKRPSSMIESSGPPDVTLSHRSERERVRIEIQDIEAAFVKVTPSVSQAQRRKYDALRKSFGGPSLGSMEGASRTERS